MKELPDSIKKLLDTVLEDPAEAERAVAIADLLLIEMRDALERFANRTEIKKDELDTELMLFCHLYATGKLAAWMMHHLFQIEGGTPEQQEGYKRKWLNLHAWNVAREIERCNNKEGKTSH